MSTSKKSTDTLQQDHGDHPTTPRRGGRFKTPHTSPPSVKTPRNDRVPAMAIEPVPAAELRRASRSVRRRDRAQVRTIQQSIERFGNVLPILITDSGEIIDGHTRVEALIALGIEMIPCIRVAQLSEREIRALRIALNRTQETGAWDENALSIELNDLIELGEDVLTLGFDAAEIDALLEIEADDGPGDDPAEGSGQPPDLDGATITQPGDLWSLRDHQVLCANARDRAAARPLWQHPVAMVFTDPPYNVPISGHARSGSDGRYAEFAEASGEMTDEAFQTFLTEALGTSTGALEPNGLVYVCMDWRHMDVLQRALRGLGLELVNLCVRVKSNGGMGSLYRSRHELVFVAGQRGAAHRNNVQLGRFGRNRTNVWEYTGATGGAGLTEDDAFHVHPTVKPISLVADAILDATAVGETVLDPFLGSGTTLLAAERTRRCCIGIEIEPAYVDLAVRRWQDLTGLDAVDTRSGETFTQRAANAPHVDDRRVPSPAASPLAASIGETW